MKEKIKNILVQNWNKANDVLKSCCEQTTPKKRFMTVLAVGGILTVAFIYTLVSSIYKIGTWDAKTEFIKLQHINQFKLQSEKDSTVTNDELTLKNYNDEYEQ